MSQAAQVRICEITGKRRYASKRDARFANSTNGHRIRAYRCEHCGDWHAAKAEQR